MIARETTPCQAPPRGRSRLPRSLPYLAAPEARLVRAEFLMAQADELERQRRSAHRFGFDGAEWLRFKRQREAYISEVLGQSASAFWTERRHLCPLTVDWRIPVCRDCGRHVRFDWEPRCQEELQREAEAERRLRDAAGKGGAL